MSASATGDDAPLVQLLISVRNSDSASAPASRTAWFNSAASRGPTLSGALPALTSAKRQSLDTHRRSVDAIAEFEVVGRHHRFEYFEQVAGDRHLAHRIGNGAVLDPETGGAAAIVAGHAVDAGADQGGDVKSLLDIGDQLGRRGLAGFEMQIIRPGRRRRRYAAMGVTGRDQSQFARGRAIKQPRGQHALID